MTKNNQSSKTPKSPRRKSKSAKQSSFGKKVLGFCIKASMAGAALLFVAGIYLDGKIDERFEKPLWDLPAVVYSRVLYIAPGEPITIDSFKSELELLNYKRVRNPRNPGEYSASSSRIELYRRPFEFEDGYSAAQHVMVTFNAAGVTKITQVDDRKERGYLRLEPKMLGMLGDKGAEQRIYLPREQFPEFLVDALLTTEDRDFYHHDGISPVGIIRAFVANLKAGRTVQGGSTLTQQLAKNLFLTRERSLIRKVQEAMIAVLLEFKYTKDQLLEIYLSEVYLGQSQGKAIHGFPLAARLYFGRPIEELRVDQLAMLVGLVKGPSYYNPWRYSERVQNRRDLILRMMMENGFLTSDQYANAASQPLDIQKSPVINTHQPAYFEQLSQELNELAGDKFNREEGLRVFTTLDPQSQAMIDKVVVDKVKQLETQTKDDLEAAAVIADRQTGEILAMVGGSRPDFAGFNRALNGRRQIGSLSKPAVFLTALSEPDTYHLASSIEDNPIAMTDDKGDVWKPRNYDRKFRGQVSLMRALASSYNIPTVNIGMAMTLEAVVDTYFQLGIDPQQINMVPSMLLGSFTLSPLEVSQMFQTMGNGGRMVRLSALRAIVSREGEILYRHWPKGTQTVSEQASWLTMFALQQAVNDGTAKYLNQNFAGLGLAGKTGTTDKNRDSWYVGIDGKEVVTVWIGRDDNKSTKLTGSTGALRLYHDYLKARGVTPLVLSRPAEIIDAPFVAQNGQVTPNCQSEQTLPVWDRDGKWAARCRPPKPLGWISQMFE